MGSFFQGDGTRAGNLPADVAIDESGGGIDRIEELDTRAFFHPEVPAGHLADDFAVAADDEVSAAFDGARQFAENGEVVALQRHAGDGSAFLNNDIAAGLDAAVPLFGDVVVDQADVAAALRALARLCLTDGGIGMAAGVSMDRAGRFDRIEKPHQKGLRRCYDRTTPEHGLCRRGGGRGFRFGIGILARLGQSRDRAVSHHPLAFTDLEIRTTRPALGGNDQCRLRLNVPTFRARYFDAMALGLIGHGKAGLGSG